MTLEEIENQLLKYLRQSLVRGEVIEPTTPLLSSGLLDSMALTQLVAHIEGAFGVAVPDASLEPENFRTTADVARLVAHIRSQARQAS